MIPCWAGRITSEEKLPWYFPPCLQPQSGINWVNGTSSVMLLTKKPTCATACSWMLMTAWLMNTRRCSRRSRHALDLQSILAHWQRTDTEEHPVGLVILMEGAEGVREPAELEDWYRRGVRIIGPAWAGTRFCGGTHEPGGLTKEGYALLERMAEFHLTLDISHMDEKAALQALDSYPGAIIASHANALALLKGTNSNRHLTDRVLQGLLERDGVIGIVPANSFLRPDWQETGGRSSCYLGTLCCTDGLRVPDGRRCASRGDWH